MTNLILNRYLPQIQLEKSLDKVNFDNLEFILQHYKDIQSIYTEKLILGQIHFSKNLPNYLKKSFRKKLYNYTKSTIAAQWERYFKKCGITKNISKMNEKEYSDMMKQCIEFDWKQDEQTKLFVNFFKYPEYIIPDDKKELKTSIDVYGTNAEFEPLKILLDYQSKIVSKTMKKIENVNSTCLIQMPTGTGKTRVAMEIVSRIFNKTPDIQIIWFANKSELLEQAYESFMHVWNHVGRFPIKSIVAWGKKQIPKIPDKRVIVFAGYKKMNNFSKSNLLKPSYVIIDEAHQILAPTYDDVLKKLTDKNAARILGLTATPGRGIDEKQNQLLVKKFQGNIVQIELDRDDGKKYEKNIIKYLEHNDILAKSELNPLRTDFKYQLTSTELDALVKIIQGDRQEFSTEMLQKLANNNTRNIQIIDKLHKLANHGKKILYFSTSKNQSILIHIVLQQLGINSAHVDGDTDSVFRRQIIRKFKETDQIQVICNYDVFSTGFDVPNLDVVFIGRPINSPVLFNQMVGRGTRGISMGGKKSFILVQVIDKFKSARMSFSPYEQYGYWDDNWKNK